MNRGDGGVDFPLQLVEQDDKVDLPFTFGGGVVDFTATGVEGCEQVERAFALILTFYPHGFSWFGGKGRGFAGSRLETGLFVDAEHHFVGRQRARIQVAQIQNRGGESGVPRGLGGQPKMMTPGFEAMMGENASHTLRGDTADYFPGHELTGQFGTVPLRKTAALQVGHLTGYLHQVERDGRQENRLAAGSRFVLQSRQSLLLESPAPFLEMAWRHAYCLRRASQALAADPQQDDTSSADFTGRSGSLALQRE